VRYSIDQALHEACSCVYPYAAGLRFDVNATAEDPDHVTNFETLVDGNWVKLDLEASYTLLGYFVDLTSSPRAYQQFVDASIVTETVYSATDVLLQYAVQRGVFEAPSEEEYSTKSFVHY
jgi:hypothetical protein